MELLQTSPDGFWLAHLCEPGIVAVVAGEVVPLGTSLPPPSLGDLRCSAHLEDPLALPVAPAAVALAEVQKNSDDGEGGEHERPPVKLDPWNSNMWNPVDSVVVVSILLLPLPTRGFSGAAGFVLEDPIFALSQFLALGSKGDLTF